MKKISPVQQMSEKGLRLYTQHSDIIPHVTHLRRPQYTKSQNIVFRYQ